MDGVVVVFILWHLTYCLRFNVMCVRCVNETLILPSESPGVTVIRCFPPKLDESARKTFDSGVVTWDHPHFTNFVGAGNTL